MEGDVRTFLPLRLSLSHRLNISQCSSWVPHIINNLDVYVRRSSVQVMNQQRKRDTLP